MKFPEWIWMRSVVSWSCLFYVLSLQEQYLKILGQHHTVAACFGGIAHMNCHYNTWYSSPLSQSSTTIISPCSSKKKSTNIYHAPIPPSGMFLSSAIFSLKLWRSQRKTRPVHRPSGSKSFLELLREFFRPAEFLKMRAASYDPRNLEKGNPAGMMGWCHEIGEGIQEIGSLFWGIQVETYARRPRDSMRWNKVV